MDVIFTINGKEYRANSKTVPISTSLNTFIRDHAHLKGTKFMCLEGGCGSCIITAKGRHPVTKEKKTWAVNSCLTSIFSCHGLDIVTVEGIGNKLEGYHPIQNVLANFNGTQCGYCSPGMVMNMYSLLESKNGDVEMKDIENSFGGNICRCTGYRPILDAFKSLAADASDDLKNICKDIEDLTKTCPKTGSPCAGLCHSAQNQPEKAVNIVYGDGNEWHKVYNLNELFEILNSIGTRPYMFVAGNTAHGVYRRPDNLEVFIDITAITDLHSSTIGDVITIGANVSLTETMEILEKAATKNPNFQYCRELIKHIDLIANVPVRDNGTIAGNLSIKHAHNEFPSDMFLILETVGAKMTIREAGSKTTIVSPKEYLNVNMDKKVIFNITLPAISEEYALRTYKIMPRAQNAHAYVNAGFLLELNDDKDQIKSARICFGGINPEFVHAIETEKQIVGKNIFTNDTLQSMLSVLSSEINPDWVLPDASSEYRKNLALSLFYKYILNIAPEGIVQVKSSFKSGGTILQRPLSSGKQVFDTFEKNWPLTKNVPKLEGHAQTAGEAQYTNDLPALHNELFAAFVIATKPGMKIGKVDASEALASPGVVAFYSAKDIPGTNDFMPTNMGNPDTEEIFCSGDVLFHGQPVGILVAESFDIANKATKLVKITYQKSGNSIPIWDQAVALFSTFSFTEEKQILYPTVEDVFRAKANDRVFDQPFDKEGTEYGNGIGATQKVSGLFKIAGQYHFTMETQVCVCVPIEDGMDIYSSTQWIDLAQIAVSDALKIPGNRLNFYVRRLGGGYGAKISRPSQIACACALAALLLNRPVRFLLTIESNMTSIGKRYGCISDYEVEVDDNGKIIKLTNNYMQDYGASLNEPVESATSEFFKNCYDDSKWKLTGKAVKTDAPSNTWCRAPGTTEGIAMIENIMEHIAHQTGKTPMSVRLANMLPNNKIREMLPNFKRDIDFEARKKQIENFNAANRWKKRGIAIVPMQYPMHYFGQLHALVSIYHGDGSVAITHGGIEMGQGINTKAAQVAAHFLGIPMEKISIKPTTNLTSPNAIVSGGSMTSEIVCYAVQKACEVLKERIKPIREKMENASWELVTNACYAANVDLAAIFQYKVEDLKTYNIWGLSCAEIVTDLLTGNVQVKRVDILEDTGESMSPGIDIGQVEGAFVMGMGYYLTENLVYNNENGELLTNRTWTYKPPGAKDIPIDFRIKFLQKSSNPFGVLRSKATGEPALCMTIVVLFALRHALNSARKDAGLADTWCPLGAPSTPDIIFLNAGNKIEDYRLN